jgi:hypothetical protein
MDRSNSGGTRSSGPMAGPPSEAAISNGDTRAKGIIYVIMSLAVAFAYPSLLLCYTMLAIHVRYLGASEPNTISPI